MTNIGLTVLWEATIELIHGNPPTAALAERLQLRAANFHGACMVLTDTTDKGLASELWLLTTLAYLDCQQIVKNWPNHGY